MNITCSINVSDFYKEYACCSLMQNIRVVIIGERGQIRAMDSENEVHGGGGPNQPTVVDITRYLSIQDALGHISRF